MFVIPKHGYKIHDPDMGDHLPAAGRKVEENSYWLRRLRDGDVTRQTADKPSASSNKQKEVKE